MKLSIIIQFKKKFIELPIHKEKNFYSESMKKLLFVIFVLQIKILFGAESYFSIHYNNIHGNSVFQGMKNEGQSLNICSYDNGTSSNCEIFA